MRIPPRLHIRFFQPQPQQQQLEEEEDGNVAGLPLTATTFEAGQTVRGEVLVSCEKPLAVHSLRLELLGRAAVSFDLFHAHYNSRSVLLSQHIQLWPSVGKNGKEEKAQAATENGEEVVLLKKFAAGKHCFPFQFTIDQKCPNSFKGAHGSIKYECKVVLDQCRSASGHRLPRWLWSRSTCLHVPFAVRSAPPALEFTTALTSERVELPLMDNDDDNNKENTENREGNNLWATISLLKDKFHGGEQIELQITVNNTLNQLEEQNGINKGAETEAESAKAAEQQQKKIVRFGLAYRLLECVDYQSDAKHHCRERKCLLSDCKEFELKKNEKAPYQLVELQTKPITVEGPSILNCPLIHKFHVLKVKLVCWRGKQKRSSNECWFQIRIY